jgi:hypothetical protein
LFCDKSFITPKSIPFISGNSKNYFSNRENNSEAYPVPSFGDTPTRAGAEVFGGIKLLFFETSEKSSRGSGFYSWHSFCLQARIVPTIKKPHTLFRV